MTLNRRTKTFAVAALALLLFAPIAHAEDKPVADLSVAYSPLYILKGYTIWTNGGSGSVAVNVNDWFGVAGDVGVYHGYVGESLNGETYMAGPRFSYRKLHRMTPFGQVLFGGSHFSTSTSGITGGRNEFAFSVGGGTDIGLGRKQKFALRFEGDYVGIRSSGAITASSRLSAGIVYHIGG